MSLFGAHTKTSDMATSQGGISRRHFKLPLRLVQLHHKACFWEQSELHTLPYGRWVLFSTFFMFFSFYQIDLQNETCVALAHLQWSINKKSMLSFFFQLQILKLHVCWILHGVHGFSQLCSPFSMEWSMNLKTDSNLSFKHVFLWC